MRGSAHSSYTPDPDKRAEWLARLAEHTEIAAEQLLGLFSTEWVHGTDRHQRELGALSLASLIERPFAATTNDDEKELIGLARNNTAVYDDAVEDTIYEDELMTRLLAERQRYSSDEKFSQLIRARRTILAFMIHSAAREDNSAA